MASTRRWKAGVHHAAASAPGVDSANPGSRSRAAKSPGRDRAASRQERQHAMAPRHRSSSARRENASARHTGVISDQSRSSSGAGAADSSSPLAPPPVGFGFGVAGVGDWGVRRGGYAARLPGLGVGLLVGWAEYNEVNGLVKFSGRSAISGTVAQNPNYPN